MQNSSLHASYKLENVDVHFQLGYTPATVKSAYHFAEASLGDIQTSTKNLPTETWTTGNEESGKRQGTQKPENLEAEMVCTRIISC